MLRFFVESSAIRAPAGDQINLQNILDKRKSCFVSQRSKEPQQNAFHSGNVLNERNVLSLSFRGVALDTNTLYNMKSRNICYFVMFSLLSPLLLYLSSPAKQKIFFRSREFNIFKEFDSVYSNNKAQKKSFSSCFVALAKIYLNLNMKQVNRNDKNKPI